MLSSNIKILDCTLRDGGYINDWRYGNLSIRSIVTRLDSAGVDIIEVGFLDSSVGYDKDRSIFPDIPSVSKTLGMSTPNRSELVAMINYGTFEKELLTPRNESVLDGIRLIFQKEHINESLELASEIKALGYRIYLNPVALVSYRDKEILDLLEQINTIKPDGVSIVDTYGVMFWEKLVRYVYLLDSNLEKDIAIGFHSHNNLQMSNANCIEYIKLNLAREIIVDASILGMGKNSGNACTELILAYLDKLGKKQVDLDQVLECAYTDIQKFLGKQSWGYDLENLITAINECSPNWTKHLMSKNTLSIANIRSIISSLPLYEKSLVSYFSNELAENKYLEFMDKAINDTESCELLKNETAGCNILVLCPGRSLNSHRKVVEAFIEENRPLVFTVNFVSDAFQTDYAFISNANRFSKVIGIYPELLQSPKLITTSNIVATERFPPYMQFNYRTLYNRIGGDSSCVLLLSLLQSIGIKAVAIAGFDGLSKEGDDYFEAGLELMSVDGANDITARQLHQTLNSKDVFGLHWLTPSKFESIAAQN